MYYQKTASSKNHNLTLFTKGASLIIIYTVRRSLEHTGSYKIRPAEDGGMSQVSSLLNQKRIYANMIFISSLPTCGCLRILLVSLMSQDVGDALFPQRLSSY